MNKYLKQLKKDTVIYGIGGILARAIGFLLLPLYTRIFTPDQYGTIEMLNIIAGFLSSILVMGMDSAQSYYFFAEREKGINAQARVVTAILQFRILWGFLTVLTATALSPYINVMFFKGVLTIEHFAIAFSGAFFTQLVFQSVEIFRLLYRPWSYILVTFSNTLISNSAAILLVLILNKGILGYIVGNAFGSVVCSIIGWLMVKNYIVWDKWHTDLWPKLLRFGGPLVPTGIVVWLMHSTDRWLLSYFCLPDQLGIYAVGAKFAIVIAFAAEIFRKAWWPIALDSMFSPEGKDLYSLVARWYLGLGMAGVVLMTVVSPGIVTILTPPSYHSAYPVIGILAFSAVFNGFFLIASAGIWKVEKTWLITASMVAGSIMNYLLGLYLVPIFAGIGAAIATSTAMAVSNIMLLVISDRYWEVHFPYKVLLFQVTIAAAAVALILYSYFINLHYSWIFGVGLLTICIILVRTYKK